MMYGILIGIGLAAAIGLFGFRFGKTSAEKEYFMKREQENEKAVLVLAEFSGLSRDECLERLHGGNKN